MFKNLFFIFLFTSFLGIYQNKPKIISGKITDSLGIVKNAHIINLNSKTGAFSNDKGLFQIPMNIGDSLRISSIQHKTMIVFASKMVYQTKKINIVLKSNIITLDEIIVKNHNLIGVLALDNKKVPKQKRDSILRNLMTFTVAELTDPVADDSIDKMRPPVVNTAHGIDAGFGAGAIAFIPFKDSERLWALRRKLAKREAFPAKILSTLGENFFFKELKIPKEKYHHFLEYCNPLGIEDLHAKNKVLQLIKILQQESKTYLKIIRKE